MKLELTEGSIGKQLFRFFLPILFGTFFQQLYNTVDAIVVGRFVGSDALAAVGGSSGMIVNFVVGFFVGLSAGASVIVSQAVGCKDRRTISSGIHTIYAFSLYGGIIISAIGYILAPALLRLLNTPTDIFDDSLIYLRVFLLGIVFMFIYNTGSALLRAIGDAKRPTKYLVICCFVNIVLDVVFVVGFKMGVLGAALATIIALAISSVLVTRALQHATEECDFRLKDIRIDWQILKKQIYIGLPGGIQSSMYSLSNMMLQAAVNGIGTDAAAAWTTLGKTDAIYWMVGGSIGTALTTVVGQNYGAMKMDRVKKSVRVALGMYYGCALVVLGALMLFLTPIIRMFTDNQVVMEITMSVFYIMAPFYVLFSFIEIFSCALRGMGDVLLPTIMTMVGICGFRVFWSVFVVPANPSMETIAWSYPLSWILTSLCFIIYYIYKIRNVDKRIGKMALSHKPE